MEQVQNRYSSIREAARVCGIGELSFRRMVQEGKIPGFYVGNRFRVDTSQLDAALTNLAETRAVIVRRNVREEVCVNG